MLSPVSRTCNLRRFHVLATSGVSARLRGSLAANPSFDFRSCSLLLLAAREQQCCWSALLRAFRVACEGRAISIRTRCPTATHTLHAPAPPPKYTRRRAHTTLAPTSTCAHTTLHCHAACNQAHAVVWARAQLARRRRSRRRSSCCLPCLRHTAAPERTPTRAELHCCVCVCEYTSKF